MKKNLTIATFISNNEQFNNDVIEIVKYLKRDYCVELIVFSNKLILDYDKNVKQIISDNTTKYKRIIKLIEISKNNNILCLDNDITTNKVNLKKFIDYCFTVDYSIAWGKIKSIKLDNFVSHLVAIDKNLSHDYIRPFLWKMNVGISLPGQIFMINKKYYIEKFSIVDTVYDDLAIGITTKKYNMPVYFTKDILGYETPKVSFKELIKQRKRWSNGFAQIIYNNRNSRMEKYVLLHGFMYHLLWIPFYIILILLFFVNLILSLIYLLVFSIILSRKKFIDIFWSFIYIIIFPFVHIIWFVYFNINLIKQYSNN